MRLFTVVKNFTCKTSADDTLNPLPSALMEDNILNANVTDISSNGISFQVESPNFLVRNAFRPMVHIGIKNSEVGSSGKIKYSLSKGTKIIMAILFSIAMAFEGLLLILLLMNQLVSPLFLLLPAGLILFTAIISILGLYVSSHAVHKHLLTLIGASAMQAE